LNLLAIAVSRAHLDLAQVILDIAAAQYSPSTPKEKKRSFRIRGPEEAHEEGYCPGEIVVTSELVDEDFTLEDVGALSASTGSKTQPFDLVTGTSPCWAAREGLEKSVKDIYGSGWEPSESYWDERDGPLVC
jgi:hypothetical protein